MTTVPTAGRLARSAALLLMLLLIGAACGSAGSNGPTDEPAAAQDPIQAAPTSQNDDASDDTGVASTPVLPVDVNGELDLAAAITELPPARTGLPYLAPPGPQPIGLTIGSLDIDTAEVIDVGVEDNGDMEIPPADKVGWYRFGTSPGEPEGSAVLAAHIAFDGEDGVFIDLDDIELGSLITVSYDDGSTAEFIATAKEQYDKDELPKDSIFARDGEPQLVLITCGGDFNRSLRSYEDNVVVFATPIERT
ncbi:MAG: class F sortase [Actinomycetota bacterium]